MAQRLDHAESGILSVDYVRVQRDKEIPLRMAVNYDWCKGCGICISFCPKDCFDISSIGQPMMTRLDVCTKCMQCVYRCPDYCITIEDLSESGEAKNDGE
ncbi:MAG: ferredoxin family protein [bacterium]